MSKAQRAHEQTSKQAGPTQTDRQQHIDDGKAPAYHDPDHDEKLGLDVEEASESDQGETESSSMMPLIRW